MIKKILHILYQPYKWLVLLPFFVLVTIGLSFIALSTMAVFGPKPGALCGVVWARLNAWMTPVWVSVRGRENVNPQQSYVIVSNHQSIYDIYLFYGWMGVDFKWVMKQEIRKIPFIGISCDRIGNIYIDRSNTEAALKSLNMAKEKIKDGTSVMFFAEGTRSKTGEIGPFKKGAFMFARDLNISILPVTVSGTFKIMPPHTMNVFPGHAKMTIHPPVDINAWKDRDISELINYVRDIIVSGYKKDTMDVRNCRS
ncbi:MAG: 1-acyl-sn-glycerol-3-phosphate acyltransferase [Deltaproteobacteria bacterium]|nr:1-acyl-sn-glycerol-3-phosphate acyltransferase [Deltaproteobacteria bacterium]